MLDRMKDLGYKHSTYAGMTVGIADIMVLHEKQAIIDAAHKQVETITKQFRRGLITDDERYERNRRLERCQRRNPTKLIESMEARNPIFMMSDSGARGNISNFTQLAGMRGLMAARMDESWNYQSSQTSVKDFLS